ncbi:hypothetical protein SDC9_65699 [bioreactor metagenome]|uniref:Uncharacterized protein n=1 Tax=bioreactor metagenome TaxID=1076179 RepID=A0A644XU25_9ZZZZ
MLGGSLRNNVEHRDARCEAQKGQKSHRRTDEKKHNGDDKGHEHAAGQVRDSQHGILLQFYDGGCEYCLN